MKSLDYGSSKVTIENGGPGQIPPTKENVFADIWENTIRRYGVVNACEWFGHAPDSDFTRDTIHVPMERTRENPE